VLADLENDMLVSVYFNKVVYIHISTVHIRMHVCVLMRVITYPVSTHSHSCVYTHINCILTKLICVGVYFLHVRTYVYM